MAYVAAASTFAVVLVLTNIIGVKLFALPDRFAPDFLFGAGDPTFTTGILTYPITFLLTDVVSELWGKKRADLMVILGFAMSALMLVTVMLARALPPSEFWSNSELGLQAADLQAAFEASFSYPHVLLFASMLAYLVAQLFDVRLYHFWWRVTEGRHMWLRNNGSTMISQLVDTAIVNGIFLRWGLQMEWPAIGGIIVNVYLLKVALALVDTPLIYLACHGLRRWLGLPTGSVSRAAPLA